MGRAASGLRFHDYQVQVGFNPNSDPVALAKASARIGGQMTRIKSSAWIGLVSVIFGFSNGALAQVPERQILGIQLGMTEEKVHVRLKELGTLVRKEEKRQEAWQIRDPSFSHLIVGFNKDAKLRYVTAVAREDKDAKRIPYDRIGDLKKARQAGDPKVKNFNYQWDLPAASDNPHMLVIAIGRDPKWLATYTLKSLEGKFPAEEDD
jgi:hypothetical protein